MESVAAGILNYGNACLLACLLQETKRKREIPTDRSMGRCLFLWRSSSWSRSTILSERDGRTLKTRILKKLRKLAQYQSSVSSKT
eukprot:scaffold6120_cov162-Amphora_coffeaeformis.AAC.5